MRNVASLPHLRARRVGWGAAGIAGTSALAVAFGSTALPTVAITGTAATIPAALLLPLAVAATVTWMWSGRLPDHEHLAGPRVRVLDAALACSAMALAASIVMAGSAMGFDIPAAAATRNVVGLVGLAAIARTVVPAPTDAAVAPVYVLLSLLLGQRGGYGAGWAWVIADGGPAPMAIATALGVGGALVVALRRPAR